MILSLYLLAHNCAVCFVESAGIEQHQELQQRRDNQQNSKQNHKIKNQLNSTNRGTA